MVRCLFPKRHNTTMLVTMQAPGTVVKKRQAATAALGSKGGIPDSAYLPLRLNPNGMAAVLYAGFIYSVPDLIGAFSVRGRVWVADLLMRGGWGVVIYGLIIFGCGLIQFGDSSPKSMGSYLNAVRCPCCCAGGHSACGTVAHW